MNSNAAVGKPSLLPRVRGYAAESMVRNSAFLLINLGVTAACSYIALSIITHVYSVAAVGISAAAISASSLVVMLTQSGVNYSLPRLLPASKNRDSLINTMHTGVFLATVIGSIIFLMTPLADKMFALGGLLFAVIFVASTCLQGCSSLLGVVLVAERESGKLAYANVVPNVVRVAAPRAFTFLGSLGAFIARVIYNVFYFFILVRMLIRRGHRFKLELSGEAAHELGRFSVGMYVAAVVGGLPQMLLPIVVLYRMGAQQSAYWSIAMTVGALLYQLPSSVTQALLPELSHRPAERKRLLLRSTLLVTGIMVPALIVAYFAAPLLLGFFGHSYTAKIIPSLHWLIYAGFVTLINYATGAVLILAKKSSAITFINTVDAIIVVGLASIWATSSRDVAIAYFIGDVGNTVLFGSFALLTLHEVGGRFEALGGDRVLSAAVAMRGPSSRSLREAFDMLSSIADQQRLADRQRLSAAHEVARFNLTEPQGLYSVFALQEAEAKRELRARHLQRPRPRRPQPWQGPGRPQTGGRVTRDDGNNRAMQFKWWLRLGTIAALCGALVVGVRVIRERALARLDAVPQVTMTTVTVTSSGPVVGELNNQYIGLSFDNSSLDSGAFDDVGNVVPLLKNLGSSTMRIGGLSADYASTGVSAAQLAGLARLAKASGWHVIYTENLGHFDANTVTADAGEISGALGTSLLALACGNEPDHYHLGLRPRSYNESGFLSDEATCLSDIRAGAPNAALEGPDLASPGWLPRYAAQEAGNVKWLGQHYYPLGCNSITRAETPQELVSTLLSPGLAHVEGEEFDKDAADAGSAHANLLIDETNSACNGGIHGVSNTYAAALWVVDFLLTGAEHGVHGMNFHGGLNTDCQGYSPLCQTGANAGTHSYTPEPVYYGMLFTHLLGPGRLLPVTVSLANRTQNITAFALKPSSGGLRLMVENLGAQPATVTLRVGGDPVSASVLHLTGTNLFATSGTTIQGATVAKNGSFTLSKSDTVRCASGGCPLTLQPYTASLVAFP